MSFVRFRKTVCSHDVGVDFGRSLRRPWSFRVVEVHVVKTKAFVVARSPLEGVNKCPRRVASDVNTVQFYGLKVKSNM